MAERRPRSEEVKKFAKKNPRSGLANILNAYGLMGKIREDDGREIDDIPRAAGPQRDRAMRQLRYKLDKVYGRNPIHMDPVEKAMLNLKYNQELAKDKESFRRNTELEKIQNEIRKREEGERK
ncbi:MAG: hypothetical protein ACKO6C_00065, partial [Alphaproteobacteria bacterium]